MSQTQPAVGQVIILNGVPRSGKSSIAAAIQQTFEGVWMNLGVDRYMQMTPAQYQPGIGLRPGGERPDLELMIVTMYRALYASIAAHSRLGLNVVADIGHHDAYSEPRGILPRAARQLAGLPVLLAGVRCPLEVVMERRRATWGDKLSDDGLSDDGAIPPPVRRWQDAVHTPGIYDLEVDTSIHTPEACAELITCRLRDPAPATAFQRLAELPEV
ncbi:MAG: chloramphenicol phosphotransferase CPT family protein [Chloroflexota bacterium]